MAYGLEIVAHDHLAGKVTAFTSDVTDEILVRPRAMLAMFGKRGSRRVSWEILLGI
jgi:hypothetical protein